MNDMILSILRLNIAGMIIQGIALGFLLKECIADRGYWIGAIGIIFSLAISYAATVFLINKKMSRKD